VPDIPPAVAVIVTDPPGKTAVASPVLLLIVATLVVSDVHEEDAVKSRVVLSL
jgi:hypothetical protein